MGKRSEIRQALRYAKSELKSAMSDKYISESELYNIVNATFELKALGASGRQLNKADKIYSKAVKFFSETNTTEVIKEIEVPGETVYVDREVIKEVEVVKEVEVPGETVYVDREVVKEVPTPYYVDYMEYEYIVDNQNESFGIGDGTLVDNPVLDFFENGDMVRIEMRAANFALDEIINWSDYTSETQPGPNNIGLLWGKNFLDGEFSTLGGSTVSHEFVDDLPGVGPGFIDLPRTFIVFANETKERHFAFEIEDIVRQTDSVG